LIISRSLWLLNAFLSTGKRWHYVLIPAFFLTGIQSNYAQTIISTDSTAVIKSDTLIADSLALGDDLKSKVKYSAEDSIIYDLANDKVYLYGKALMDYEDIHLSADYIELNFDTKTLFSKGLPDSSGIIAGTPVFKQGSEEFKSETITYNFDSKKGRITGISTTEGDSHISGTTVKKQPDNTTYIRNGYYTTCDNPHPHYYIYSNKIKVIPDNKIITGPANLVIADVPTPLFVPFGFFPNKKERTSGILFPAYGQSDRGFYLQNGGYYFGLSDHIDAALTGDIFTLGSWRTNVQSNYAWRYRFNGNMSLNYSHIRYSEPELPDFQVQKDFFIRWNHSQDPKANPNHTFSTSVNAGSTSFYRNNLSNINNFLTNTFQSSVSYSKIWPGKPYSFSSSLNHSQNTQTGVINLSLPSANFSVSRISIFKHRGNGPVRWYEKTGISYSASVLNTISTNDSLIFKKGWEKDFRYGMQHSIPVSTSIILLKYFTLSPSVNYAEKWYLQTTRKRYLVENDSLITYTKDGFRAARDVSAGASLNTRLYGLLQFRKGKIAAIRHVFTPAVSYAYKPNLVSEKQGIYRYYPSATGDAIRYSIFEGTVFGGPSDGRSSVLNFNMDNNLEMKVRQKTDSAVNLIKVKLLESLAAGVSYNLLADSFPLSNIGLSARTVLFNKVNVDYSASFDPYAVNETNQRINRTEMDANSRLARFTNGNLSVSTSLFNKQKVYKSTKGTEQELKNINKHPDEYVDFTVPFSLNIAYNAIFKARESVLAGEQRISHTTRFSGDISLTPGWKATFNSGYDFSNEQWSTTFLGFYRDLHCWELRFNWVPFGQQQRYDFQINVKSSVLQDLKLTKKSNPALETF
jgi:lipopolysaccharide assembly outer membrane protein LptD (OstA)